MKKDGLHSYGLTVNRNTFFFLIGGNYDGVTTCLNGTK